MAGWRRGTRRLTIVGVVFVELTSEVDSSCEKMNFGDKLSRGKIVRRSEFDHFRGWLSRSKISWSGSQRGLLGLMMGVPLKCIAMDWYQ